VFALLALSWHWVRDKVIAVASSAHRSKQLEEGDVSSEGVTDRAGAKTAPLHAQDAPPETVSLSTETDEDLAQARVAVHEEDDAPSETGDDSAMPEDASTEADGG
jgi:hypothetical protein